MCSDVRIVTVALEGLENILKVGCFWLNIFCTASSHMGLMSVRFLLAIVEFRISIARVSIASLGVLGKRFVHAACASTYSRWVTYAFHMSDW